MAFYAHSTERRDRRDWQGLADHLNGVGERAARHAEPFGGQLLARVAGQLHDLGKYTEKVDHATWGARIACARMSGKPDQNVNAVHLASTTITSASKLLRY